MSENNMKLIYPPEYFHLIDDTTSIFLAGSIEMGKAEDWQNTVVERLSDKRVTIFNPRRLDWDSSWEQTKDNEHFSEQVNWELDHLHSSDYILMYFQPGTYSPISLLELGMFGAKCKVICPEGFWRKGNVDIVCERYGITQFPTLDYAIDWFSEIL